MRPVREAEIEAARGRAARRGEPRGRRRPRRGRIASSCEPARAAGARGRREGEPLPARLLAGERGMIPLVVPYEVAGRRERLVYLSRAGDLAAYEELRSGFTAAVSHELRTPLARLLTLLETAALPGEDVAALSSRPRGEVEQVRGADRRGALPQRARVGRPGRRARRDTPCCPCWRRSSTSWRSGPRARACGCGSEGDPEVSVAVRPRMLRVVARNLAENAIRYAGPGATFTLTIERTADGASSSRAARRRRRRRRGRAAAPLRALLPRPTARAPRAARGSASRS